MKLAIVSDVHGNLTAFDAILSAIEAEQPDQVVHGGDLALNGPQPAEVVDRIRELGWPGVVGNTEDAFTDEPRIPGPMDARLRAMMDATSELLGAERIAWLRGLPPEW